MNKLNVYAVRSETYTSPTSPYAGHRWKQLAMVAHEHVYWLELVPALLAGWNVRRSWIHGPNDWPGYTEADIVAFKAASRFPFEDADASERDFAREWWRKQLAQSA